MTKHESKGGIFIGDAPDDVLNLIFSGLPQKAGLVELAQVCKRFNALVLSHLYSNIRLGAKKMEECDSSSLKADELPPGLEPDSLSTSLAKYPYLCNHVRKLSLKVHHVTWYENPGGHQRLLQLLPAIQELSLNPPPKVYSFPMSDRLTTMKLDIAFEPGQFWAGRRRADSRPFDLNEYLSKPALRKLQIEHIERFFHNPTHTGNPGTSVITDLRFIDWRVEKTGILASVLPSIRHLKYFVLDVVDYGSEHGLAPHDYGLLLQQHSASLEELIVAYSDDAYHDGSSFPRKALPVMGSLIGYHNLKRLAIPEPFLVALKDPSFHKMLPPQLEELQIQYPTGVRQPVIDRQGDAEGAPPYRLLRMQKLAKNKETLIPRLKRVIWWFQQNSEQVSLGNAPRFDPPDFRRYYSSNFSGKNATRTSDDPRKGPIYGPPQDMDKLAEDFENVGVKFELVSTPFLKDTPFGEYMHIQ